MGNWRFGRTRPTLVCLGVLQPSGRRLQHIHYSIIGFGREAGGRVDFRLDYNVCRLGHRSRNVCLCILRPPEIISGFGFFYTEKSQGAICVFQLKNPLKISGLSGMKLIIGGNELGATLPLELGPLLDVSSVFTSRTQRIAVVVIK